MGARRTTSPRRLLLGALVAGLACTDDRMISPPPVAALAVFPDTATVFIGDSAFLQAVARDQNGHAYIGVPTTWSSGNPAVATVSSTGLAKGVAAGTDTITATSEGLAAQAVVTVLPPPQIAFSRDSVGFGAVAHGPNPSPDTLLVTNKGGGKLAGLALDTVAYGAGASGWLNATLSSATAPDTLVLTARTGSLAVGTYTASVPVIATNAVNSPHALKVTFTLGVGAASSIAANAGNAQSATVATAVPVPPSVVVRDQYGNPVGNVAVTFAVASGGGTVTGAAQATNASGIATVGSWTLGTTAGQDTLTATATGLSGSPVIFTATATPGPATSLLFTQQPTTAQAGAPISPPVQVTAHDNYGNVATSYGGNVTVAIGTNPNLGTLFGTTTVAASAGVATFSTLSIDKTGTGYTLTAAAPGLVGATSAAFNIMASTTPSASQSSVVVSAGSITACATACSTGGGMAALVTVTVRDQFGNPISGASVALSSTGSNNSFTPASSGTTDVTGSFQATFSSSTAQGKTITAVANGTVTITQQPSVTVNPAGVSAGQSSVTAATSPITACATGCAAGSTASTITVTVRDAFNNTIAGAAVSLSSSGTGNAFAPGSGTSDASGVFSSTFSSTRAELKTISATAAGTAISQTASVTVNAAAPASLALNAGNNQSARVGAAVGTTPSVLVTDAFGNVVPGASVSFGSLTGGGSISGSPATTNGNGIAALGSWTLGATVGDSAHGTYLNTVTASVTGTNTVQFTDSAFYSLAGDVMPIFGAGGCPGCHSSGFPPDFTSATTFVNTTVNVTGTCNASFKRVLPGDASNSLLQRFLNGSGTSCAGGVMPPPPGAALSPSQRRIVSDWINRSAQNN